MQAIIRNDLPNAKVRNIDLPFARSGRSFGVLTASIPAQTFAGAGYLMGMLALTYTNTQTIPEVPATFRSDEIPFVRIRNTD